ncbi:hypothetical protein B9Z19DRAFT_653923 [Tuber borchii]|uniref:DUF4219 domain-containing protein n=1 Tax=Tuber borchii TaxID=42251 RepID=A0A2T7A068_TUBBO|nr:hypothetical protein B9Z19DRAFT_653923 [Tuber borchii]
MDERVVISSPFQTTFEKLNGLNHRVWLMRMQDYLMCEGLWDLTSGHEEILEKPKDGKLDRDYEKKWEKYQAQRLLIQKAIGTIRLAMTDDIAAIYHKESFTTPAKIWDHVVSSYETIANCEEDDHYIYDSCTMLGFRWIRPPAPISNPFPKTA